MIDRAKVEQFIKKMDGNKYLATIFLIKRINQIQANQAKLIAGSQRFMVEQAIDEFLAGKSTMSFDEPNPDVLPDEEHIEETVA
jgi:hypothetical protein